MQLYRNIRTFSLLFLVLQACWIHPANSQNAFDSLSVIVDQNFFSFATKSRQAIDQMYEIANTHPDSLSMFTRCLYAEALVQYGQGATDSTLIHRITLHLDGLNNDSNSYEYGLLSLSLGLCLDAEGSYSEAFKHALEAEKLFTTLNKGKVLAKTKNLLGNICSHIRLYSMSEKYYTDALLIENSGGEHSRIKMNLFRLLHSEGNINEAIDSLKTLIPEVISTNDLGLLAAVYLNLGVFYFSNRDYENMHLYSKTGETIISNIDNLRLESNLNHNLGLYHFFKKRNYLKALEYFNLVKQSAIYLQNYEQLSSIYYIISYTYASLNRYDSAFFYTQKFQELNSKLVNNPKTIEAYQAYISTLLEVSENKLVIAEQQVEIKRRQFLFAIFLSGSIFLLSIFLLEIVQQKKSIQEGKNKELARQLEHEKRIQQLQKEKQNEVIESNMREITSYSMQLFNKNNVLLEIQEVANKIQHTPKKTQEQILNIINANIQGDDDWQDIKSRFNQVHPDFFEKLKSISPNLTEVNLRMCAYFKMGISNKQIAQILNVSPNSIIVHRYRLKRSLNLQKEDNLDDFIRSL